MNIILLHCVFFVLLLSTINGHSIRQTDKENVATGVAKFIEDRISRQMYIFKDLTWNPKIYVIAVEDYSVNNFPKTTKPALISTRSELVKELHVLMDCRTMFMNYSRKLTRFTMHPLSSPTRCTSSSTANKKDNNEMLTN